jgi:hypothetical protein
MTEFSNISIDQFPSIKTHKEKYAIFYVSGGIGKNIIATSVIRNIKNQFYDRKIIVCCSYPEIFLHNPHVYRVFSHDSRPYFYDDYIKNKDTIIFKQDPYDAQNCILGINHITECWLDMYDLKLDNIYPELFFNQIEKERAKTNIKKFNTSKKICAIQINGGSIRDNNMSWYKNMPISIIENLVNYLTDDFYFYQIKADSQPEIKNVPILNGNIRDILSILQQTDTAITIDSFVQHAMASFKISSLVGWVGTSIKTFGYDIHSNIESKLDLSKLDNKDSLYWNSIDYPSEEQLPLDFNIHNLFDINELYQSLLKIKEQLN